MEINYGDKSILFKVVYHGPGLCGKTTNLQEIFRRSRPEQRLSQSILEIPTTEDKTLTFDLLPMNIGQIRGLTATFSFYTVPGQVHYKKSRELILQGVDGVVFVADSQPEMRDENIRMLGELKGYLHTMNLPDTPIVTQFNKRDLPGVMDVGLMKKDLLEKVDDLYYEAIALDGTGVMETMETVVRLAVAQYHYPTTPTG